LPLLPIRLPWQSRHSQRYFPGATPRSRGIRISCSARHRKHRIVIGTRSSTFMGRAYGTDATVPVARGGHFRGNIY
jgi:hypothetical protein